MSDITVVAIDPGTISGVAIYTINPVLGLILSIETFNINTRMDITKDNYHIRNIIKCSTLNKLCTYIINEYNPYMLCMESSFINPHRPKAALALVGFIATINNRFHELIPDVIRMNYMPKYIKAGVGAGGNADKADMLRCVANISDITDHVYVPSLSEHEIDALAIGYIGCGDIMSRPFKLFNFT